MYVCVCIGFMVLIYLLIVKRFSHLRHRLQFGLMGKTIEELLGVGTKISPRINEDFALIKFALNELHSVEVIVDRSWNFEFTSR